MLDLNDGDARAKYLWVRVREKASRRDILVGTCHRPSNQNQDAEEIFYKQLTRDSKLLALVLMEGFNLADVFWKYSREKQPRSFLHFMEGDLPDTAGEEVPYGRCLLDLLSVNREGLMGDKMVGDEVLGTENTK